MRIKLKFQRKTSAEYLFLFVAILCVSSFALLEHMSISIPVFSLVKNPLLYIGGICILTQLGLLIKTFMKRKYLFLWLALLLFCALLFASVYTNRNPKIGESPMRGTVRAVLFLVELYALMIWISERGHTNYFINFLFYYVLLLVVVTDVLLLTGLITYSDGSHTVYLVGTKFVVSYLHMDLLTLWFLKADEGYNIRNIPKLGLVFTAILLIVISVRVECMTGVLGCLILFICFLLIDRPSRKGLSILNAPVTLFGALVINLIFPFISELIVSIPFVNYFVVEIMGKSENLTGRIEIFEIFSRRMEDHWAFGFGFGNENLAAKELFGYANAQNSLLQWILRAGVVNTVMLVVLLLMIFRYRAKLGEYRRTMPLVILIYVYIFLGSVEITFSMSFIMWVFVLFVLVSDRRQYETPNISENSTSENTIPPGADN